MHSILTILEEATDSAGPDLISLEDLKLALGITDNSEDVQLQAMITFQSRIIADYCDRRFGLAQAIETFTFDRGETMLPRQALVLKLFPVLDIIEVSTAGTSDDYEFDPESGRLWAPGVTTNGKIAVTYSGGYDLPEDAPARLQQALIRVISEVRAISTRDRSVREVAHGDARVSYYTTAMTTGTSGYLSGEVIDLLSAYRRLYVA
jgi:Phage gp6-like head-tail connector protein